MLTTLNRREEILNGILTFPLQLMNMLNSKEEDNLKEMFQSIWHNFLREKSTNMLAWYNAFEDKKYFNQVIMLLSKAGWITSTVEGNYAFITMNESKILKWVSKEELTKIRRKFKFEKYRLKATESKSIDKVQINNKKTVTGLQRKGFAKAGNNIFKYDRKYLNKYLYEIAVNVCKGLTASTKDITYEDIVCELIGYHSENDHIYTLGENVSDSRGRSIFQCTKKVFNPIACKDARALIICEEQKLTYEGFNIVYAAIAELLGYRGKDTIDKIKYGIQAYNNKTLPKIEKVTISTSGMNTEEVKRRLSLYSYDNLHKIIWLERIYDNLSEYNGTNWCVPIELDATASMLQLIGILTNDHTYMDLTNLIGEDIKDPWTTKGLTREHNKKSMTPILYGSSAQPNELWTKNKIPYTQEQLNIINKELDFGKYKNAKDFKEHIIKHVQPNINMQIEIWKDTFYVECNKFVWESTDIDTYILFTSQQNQMKIVTKEVHRTHDLNQFKRYFVTLLIHNLDSQIADYVSNNLKWVLPIHDAFIIHPNDGMLTKELYLSQIKEIYKNRHNILNKYFNSIGITERYNDVSFEQISDFSSNCLK